MLAENTLLKTAYHFLLLLFGFDTLTYRKGYDTSPTLVGHQDSFLAPLLGSEAPLVGGVGTSFESLYPAGVSQLSPSQALTVNGGYSFSQEDPISLGIPVYKTFRQW